MLADAVGAARVTGHPGNFFKDSIPRGYDMVSLIRILHDHDDEPAQALLANIRASLAPRRAAADRRTDGANSRGRTDGRSVFSGFTCGPWAPVRPRSPAEIIAMTKKAGFASARPVATAQPVNASVIIARA